MEMEKHVWHLYKHNINISQHPFHQIGKTSVEDCLAQNAILAILPIHLSPFSPPGT